MPGLRTSEIEPLLERAGLPRDYPRLSSDAQKQARLDVLTSWYDPTRPQELCSNVDNFCKAMFLWSEFYYKPADINRGTYHFRDMEGKYDLIRTVMSDPIEPEEPGKSIITAARRLGKTQTLVVEMTPFMAITRPFTQILVSEYNETRTREEISKIKFQIENNERIHADFGGKGVLFPKANSSSPWNSSHLTFLNNPGCSILGHSLNSAQRGRGPIFGIWDDPEPDDMTYNKEWRRWLLEQLFNVYLPMFHKGGKLVWIGTPIHQSSALSLALRGCLETDSRLEEIKDVRFRDFRKAYFPLVYKGPDGKLKSRQPERLTVEGFRKKMEINPSAASAELLCRPVTPGQRAFPYDHYRHGYMQCVSETGSDYFLDLLTGEEKSWNEFTRNLRVFAAADPADGTSPDSDPGAVVFVGIDERGTTYVLDVFVGRVGVEGLITRSYAMAERWSCELLAWEETALGVFIGKTARLYVDELREKGKAPPAFVGINNARRSKVQRVLTMIPLFGKKLIRFRYNDVLRGPDGRVHKSVPLENYDSYHELILQVREFTDQGIRGPDDAIDALEMAVRISAGVRAEKSKPDDSHTLESSMERWKKAGVGFDKKSVPVSHWTNKMYEDHHKSLFSPRKYLQGVVPYV